MLFRNTHPWKRILENIGLRNYTIIQNFAYKNITKQIPKQYYDTAHVVHKHGRLV